MAEVAVGWSCEILGKARAGRCERVEVTFPAPPAVVTTPAAPATGPPNTNLIHTRQTAQAVPSMSTATPNTMTRRPREKKGE